MDHIDTEVAVLGCGVAGTAIALNLVRRGIPVTVVYRREDEGSSFSNQKWKHSGALYPDKRLARAAWEAFGSVKLEPERRYILGPAEAQFFSDDYSVLDALQSQWREWETSSWGMELTRFALSAGASVGEFGESRFVGGFRTPDCVIDFPAMIRELRLEMKRAGVVVRDSSNVREIIRDGDRITGVVTSEESGETHIRCRHCVVAMGGWSPRLLKQIGVFPPVRVTKSNVLVLPTQMVDRITVWIRHEVTVVPYQGQTLIADARFVPVEEPDNLEPHWPHVEELLNDLGQCFPRWKSPRVTAYGCLKTAEMTEGGIPNPNIALYTCPPTQGYCHGIQGLTVVFPGKASLMWTVAEMVGAQLAFP